MDTSTLIFDIQRTDDRDFLALLREEATDSLIYSEEELAAIYRAIDERFSQLNLLALEKNETTEGR